MTQDEIAKLIPDNVVEAAAKDDWNRCRKGALAWDCVSEMFKEGARIRARASLAAGLAAWGGMEPHKILSVRDNGEGYDLKKIGIILPIQEPTP